MSKQPKKRLLQLQGYTLLPGSQGYGNRGGLLGVSLQWIMVLDVTLRSHDRDDVEDSGRTQGSRQEFNEVNKIRHHVKERSSGYKYATLAHVTHGRLGDEAKEQIRVFGDEACSHSSMKRLACTMNRLACTLTLQQSCVLRRRKAIPFCSMSPFASQPRRQAKCFDKEQCALMQN